LKILKLCDKKKLNHNSKNVIEVDSTDLERLKGFTYSDEYLSIHNRDLEGKTIQQWFQVNDLSYWWFVDPIISPKFDQIALFIDRLEICIKKYNPEILQLEGYFDKFDIIKNMCELNMIKFEPNRQIHLKFLLKYKIQKLKRTKLYNVITKNKYKKRVKIYKNLKSNFIPKKNSTIITSYSLQRKKVIDINSGKTKNEEFFIKPVLDELKNKHQPYLCVDLDYTLKGDTAILQERIKSVDDWIPIDILLNKKKSDSTQETISSLKKSVNELISYDLKSKFIYKEISVWTYLKPFFEDIFLEPYLPSYVHLVEELEKFLKELQPKMIIQVYEPGPLAKAFVVVGEKLGIKTVGIQHGNFLKSQADYMMKNIRTKNYLIGNPISDSTLVFGEYYKKMLNEFGNYPLDKIHVTGNLTLYNLDKIKNILDKEKLLLKNNLPDKKIVLFALSFRFGIFKDNPDIRILKILYDGLKDQEDTIVYVRPHPGDKINQDILNQICPSKNFILSTKNSNFEDIFLSDIVVLYTSTLGLESALFEKTVLYTGESKELTDNMYYDYLEKMIRNDVAQYVPLNNLINSIKSIKKDTVLKISDSEKRKKYLEEILNYGNKINLSEILEL